MVDREDVEALLEEAEQSNGSLSHVDAPTLAALCRAWLAGAVGGCRYSGSWKSYIPWIMGWRWVDWRDFVTGSGTVRSAARS